PQKHIIEAFIDVNGIEYVAQKRFAGKILEPKHPYNILISKNTSYSTINNNFKTRYLKELSRLLNSSNITDEVKSNIIDEFVSLKQVFPILSAVKSSNLSADLRIKAVNSIIKTVNSITTNKVRRANLYRSSYVDLETTIDKIKFKDNMQIYPYKQRLRKLSDDETRLLGSLNKVIDHLDKLIENNNT
ncbi:MAG: hypothetical protein AB7V50_11660, partial [Vampirovibrionia bacterium]